MLIDFFHTGTFKITSLLPGLFPLEIFLMISLLLIKSPKRSRFKLKYALALSVVVIFSLFVPNFKIAGFHFLITMLLSFTFKFLFVLAVSFFCYKIQLSHLLLIGTLAFCTQNLSDNILSSIMIFVSKNNKVLRDIVFALVFIAVFALAYYMLYVMFMRKTKGKILTDLGGGRAVVFLVMTLFVANFLNSFINWILLPGVGSLYKVIGKFVLVLCDLAIIVIQINFLMMDHMTHELNTIRSMWDKDRETYESEKTRLESFQVWMHDLKHVLNHIEGTTADEIKSELSTFAGENFAVIETGNKALDVVVNEKQMLCRDKKIELSILADGKLIGFMNEVDIYSMFGNILDNAIEIVSQLKNADIRIISLSVSNKDNHVIIRQDNYCAKKPVFKNGLPLTTKEDKNKHGFGVKSIAMLAGKYGGAYSFSVQDGMFSLEVSIPRALEG